MGGNRIARVDVIPAALPVGLDRDDELRGPAQQHVFLRLETDSGVVGWGEARALPSWTGETLLSICGALRDYCAPVLLGSSPFARNAVMATIDEIITGTMPTAKSAVDIALFDLQGQLSGLAVHELFGGKIRSTLPLCHSIRSGSPEEMHAQARASGATCLKVKVTGEPERDAERLAAVDEAAPQAQIWLDANQNYTPTSAVTFLNRISNLKRIACLQQPVPSTDWAGMARLRERSPLPIAADESVWTANQVVTAAQLGAADLVVLKVCKSGGLRELVRTAEVARCVGLDLLGSGLTESGVGLAAAVHLYACLKLRLPPQLNGLQYLESMCVHGLQVDPKHGIKVPDGPGLGVIVDEDRIRAYAVDV